jgi:hypothetical protein
MATEYRVVLIVDRNFGAKLREIPPQTPVWIVATPANSPEIRERWAQHPNATQFDGTTSFNDVPDLSPDLLAEEMVEDIELHHGALSHDPPMNSLEIIGCIASIPLVIALESLEFSMTSETELHLRFERRPVRRRRS